jgi:hypothetical protein
MKGIPVIFRHFSQRASGIDCAHGKTLILQWFSLVQRRAAGIA